MRLKDKKVIVTGAASGIGREITRLFAAERARVAAVDINETGLGETCADIRNIEPVVTDVGSTQSVRSAFESVCLKFGGLDI